MDNNNFKVIMLIMLIMLATVSVKCQNVNTELILTEMI